MDMTSMVLEEATRVYPAGTSDWQRSANRRQITVVATESRYVTTQGSISGLISGGIGLVVLGLVLLQGIVTYRLTGSRVMAAVLQSLLHYAIILPQGVLFRM